MPSNNSRYHPCLPQKLLDEFKTDPLITAKPSNIYNEQFEQFRIKVLSQKSSCEIEVLLEDSQPKPSRSSLDPRVFGKIDLFTKGQNRTCLHMAAKRADIPLAYECIRIGTAINFKDKDGITALLLACIMLRSTKTIKEIMKTQPPPAPGSSDAEVLSDKFLDDEFARHLRIATLFVEQHADVNVTVDGDSSLSIAAEIACWPFVELLIRHGAKVPSVKHPGYPTFRSAAQRSKFQSIVRTVKPSDSRPLRRCPCWSGELLKDCHAAGSIPYPAEYICLCGSKKVHGRCCMRREFRHLETWNEENDWIMPVREMPLHIPQDDAFQSGFSNAQQVMSNLFQSPGFDMEAFKSRMKGFTRELLGSLLEGTVDPAFQYAMDQVDFMPRRVLFLLILSCIKSHIMASRLWNRNLSRVECKKRADEWNAAVDEYVASGIDGRPVWDIEANSKIGLNGGPLYKGCEAEDCDNIEGRYVEKMKCCSSCKLVKLLQLPAKLRLTDYECIADRVLQPSVSGEGLVET